MTAVVDESASFSVNGKKRSFELPTMEDFDVDNCLNDEGTRLKHRRIDSALDLTMPTICSTPNTAGLGDYTLSSAASETAVFTTATTPTPAPGLELTSGGLDDEILEHKRTPSWLRTLPWLSSVVFDAVPNNSLSTRWTSELFSFGWPTASTPELNGLLLKHAAEYGWAAAH
ncbi:hypothetical protein LTR37_010267 [Vermiconidia calcicola]|uniref:Uncharacterized protein n=1 Tax=Vermiconidia calcicola TaxID=1690605 RepID=A0ACC3N5N6_9PEZI|nr:hypothetical protein LTR37_010267 [Vermiconidia calcicola]